MARVAILVVVSITLIGCGAASPLLGEAETDRSPEHTLIYVIHGDGSYLYHEDGQARQADREAVDEARLVARNAPRTEVFIFHLTARRGLIGLFERSDGRMYHYRDGRLLDRFAYRRDPSGSGLSREAAIYHRLRDPMVEGRSLLFYGHSLDEGAGEGYHSSQPDRSFGLSEFVRGLDEFGAVENPFELLVLSTCNNGTPGTVAALAARSNLILASPGPLHLSFIDSHPLHRAGLVDGDTEQLATELGQWAFNQLEQRTRTAVTLALYDTRRLESALETILAEYVPASDRFESNPAVDNVDCGDALDTIRLPNKALISWYRAPAFGRTSQKATHSGWGCSPGQADETANPVVVDGDGSPASSDAMPNDGPYR